jgi:arylsulfatase A-like enzyme
VLFVFVLSLLGLLSRGRRAIALRAAIAVSALAALLHFGYRLNRHALAGFWKEARNAGTLPVGWEAVRALAANVGLLLLVFALALLIERLGRVLLERAGAKEQRLFRARTWGLLLVPAAVFAATALLRPDATGRPNVLLIAFDTTRSDHLTVSGYPRETAPHTSRVAADGTLFAETVSQAPWTLSSFASMLTGLYPSTHGAYIGTKERLLRRDHVPYLAERYATLSEVFRNAGYTTVCEAANTYLRFGLEQGYDRCRVELRPAGPTADALLAFLGKRTHPDRPFFAFLHFNDAHMPNVPPTPYERLFPTSSGRPHTNEEKWEWRYTNGEGLSGESFTDFREHKIAIYDGCLRYMDDQVGRVLAWLDANGLAGETIVGIVSDHGEEFWDHAEEQAKNYRDPRGFYGVGHGHTLFDEQLRLLLVLRGPGVPRGKIIPSRVRAIDIGPTLLELARLPSPRGVEGSSLVPLLRGSEKGDRASIAEAIIYGSDRRAIVRDGYKYVYSPDEPRFLFDLAADPAEKVNLIDREPARAEELRREIEAWIALRSSRGPEVQGAIDEKTLEELKALGYVE